MTNLLSTATTSFCPFDEVSINVLVIPAILYKSMKLMSINCNTRSDLKDFFVLIFSTT